MPGLPLSDPSDSQADLSAPSLVTRLQQWHGLTKKKVYGTKPARQPFFRDERIREKYRVVPTPLAIPPSVSTTSPITPIPSRDPRNASRPTTNRIRRLGDKNLQGSPTDVNSRRQSPWPRRGSRLSSPESDACLSSPTSVSTYSTMSPVLPIHHDFDYFSSNVSSPVSPPADATYITQPGPQSVGTSLLMPLDSGVSLTEPSWLQNQYSPVTPLSQETSSVFPSQRQLPPLQAGQGSMLNSGSMIPHIIPHHSSSYPPFSEPQLPNLSVGPGSTSGKKGGNRSRSEPMPVASTSRPITPPIDDGDRPFIFNPEYEAATAARLEEVLQGSSTYRYPVPPPRNKPIEANVRLAPPTQRSRPSSPSPLSSHMALSYTESTPYSHPYELLPNATQPPSSIDANLPASYSFYSSSSLTGWAG